MEEFFGFLKVRIGSARKYGPAARDYALFRTPYHAGLRSEEPARPERPDVHVGPGPFGSCMDAASVMIYLADHVDNGRLPAHAGP